MTTSCAGRDGAWPSLARRPIEGPGPVVTATGRCATVQPSCVAATVPAATAPPAETRVVPVALGDIAARLAVIERDLTDAASRLTAQETAARAAAAAARGAKPDSAAWASAQVELTALDRIGNQVGDIRTRLDAIAGTLAEAGAGGTDIAAPLATTGRLIARTVALQTSYDGATAALR